MTLLAGHWLADFVLQSDRMAKQKATMPSILLQHVTIYTFVLTIVFVVSYWILITPSTIADAIVWFFLITFVAHFVTDFFMSKINSYLWREQRVHDFFVSVGFDQLLHAAQLYFTLRWVLTGSVL